MQASWKFQDLSQKPELKQLRDKLSPLECLTFYLRKFKMSKMNEIARADFEMD